MDDAGGISSGNSDTDWSQELSVTFSPSMEGWATLDIDLMEYESGNEVYIWPEPVLT